MKIEPKKSDNEQHVEILDNSGNTFLYVPLSFSLKKKLTRKISLVTIRNKQNQLLMKKRPSTASQQANLWDVSVYSHVFADESYEDAGLRGLRETFNIHEENLHEITRIPYIDDSKASLLASVFITSKLAFQGNFLLKNFGSEIMHLNISELKAIIEHSPELFTSELLWLVRTGWLEESLI